MKKALTVVALLCISGSALTEEKHHVSYKTSAANTKYNQQLNVAAGDASGHIVRVFDLTRNHRDASIMVNGIKLVEESARGITDVVDGNGSAVFYSVFTMENGDKCFARSTSGEHGRRWDRYGDGRWAHHRRHREIREYTWRREGRSEIQCHVGI